MVKWPSKALLFPRVLRWLLGKISDSRPRFLAPRKGSRAVELATTLKLAEAIACRLIRGEGKCPVVFAHELLRLLKKRQINFTTVTWEGNVMGEEK